MDNNNPDMQSESQARLERLSRYSGEKSTIHSESYSALIRRLKFILPLLALAIVAALMTWPSLDKDIAILKQDSAESLQTIRKNELTNPRFESVDDKNQPYTLTAIRAVQDDNNEDLMHLEKPEGELKMSTGKVIALQALKGLYEQESQKLALQNNVRLLHNDGYEIKMSKLDLDMQAETAISDSEITGQGPAGTLHAVGGLNADNTKGLLIFKGPAKLVLYNSGSLQGLQGEASP